MRAQLKRRHTHFLASLGDLETCRRVRVAGCETGNHSPSPGPSLMTGVAATGGMKRVDSDAPTDSPSLRPRRPPLSPLPPPSPPPPTHRPPQHASSGPYSHHATTSHQCFGLFVLSRNNYDCVCVALFWLVIGVLCFLSSILCQALFCSVISVRLCFVQ